ncbi:MAG TPA: hypothetical protein VHQ97_03325 [Solirubrobacterales bacterium]|jgi:uncharacterized membrane protein YgcG|nr:hypothetical protein [Solirubrobacterales bacterium]
MRRSPLFAAVVPIAALVIAGCGGGGDETTDTTAAAPVETTPTLTKADLLKQGDAICAEVNAAVGTLGESSTEGASRVAQEADIYKGMVERLKGLGMPEEAEGYEEFIGAADELAQAQSDAALAAARGESEGLETAETEASTALSSFQSAASEYGFEDCSEAPSAPVPTSGAQAPSEEPESEAETGGVEEAAPEEVEEAAPEEVEEAAPETETGGAGSTEAGGGTGGGGGEEAGGGSSSGGVGPG